MLSNETPYHDHEHENNFEHVTFVQAVCLRPKMYTLTGSIEEVFCFLKGFYDGMGAHSFNTAANHIATYSWDDFILWANTKLGQKSPQSWIILYQYLVKHYANQSVLLHLEQLYQQYIAEIPRPNMRE